MSTVSVVLARPSVSLPAVVLRRDAGAMVGWPVFWPEDDRDRAHRGPLPRRPSLLAGEVRSARWDAARRVVVGEVACMDRLAALLARVGRSLRFRVVVGALGARGAVRAIPADPENCSLVVEVAIGGASTGDHALLEAAAGEAAADARSEEGPMGRMTLLQAMQTREVRGVLRELVREEAPAAGVALRESPAPAPLRGPAFREALASGALHRPVATGGALRESAQGPVASPAVALRGHAFRDALIRGDLHRGAA